MMTSRRPLAPFLAAACIGLMTAPAWTADPADAVRAGLGSYTLRLPQGAKEPPDTVFKTDAVRGPLPTNDWASSLLWSRYSEPQFAHPLAVQAGAAGLRIFYPGATIHADKVAVWGGMAGGGQDFILGHSAAADFPDARLDGYSDWFVTALFASGDATLRVTYGHGGPFVYALYGGGEPRLTFAQTPQVWAGDAASPVLGVSVGPRHYGLFGPTGATWAGLADKVLTCRTGGKPYFAVAVLPDRSPETLALFRRYACNHVTDTQVDWAYDEKTAAVTTRFAFRVHAYEGKEPGTLFALYPHQWTRAEADFVGPVYGSVRGEMRLARGAGFTTRATFPGVLPALPDAGGCDKARLARYVDDEARAPAPGLKDTYWEGKRLGKVAALAPIAEQAGAAPAARQFLEELQSRLQNWLTATDGQGRPKSAGVFYYNATWGTLIGYPASYGSDTQLNDHHFHYGYFVKAAAEAARRDRAWAADAQWGGLVRALINDIACPRRNDPRWPFLRCFDPYAGHSWASGHARFGDGNNQESSSEAMNAWAAIVLWGQAAGDRPLRDLGIYLYTTEMHAVHEYWFDCLGRNRPKAYTPSKIVMVWGGKGVNETWFSKKPEVMHGINWLPIHGGSLYLGHYPDYVRRDYDALAAEKGGADWDEWADLVWMWRALADPQDALRQFDARADAFKPEGGNSRANTYHWIGNLAALGRVDASVTADDPLYAVFTGPRERTYVAYAMTGPPRTVTFSDGTTLPLTGPGFALKRRALPPNAPGKPAG